MISALAQSAAAGRPGIRLSIGRKVLLAFLGVSLVSLLSFGVLALSRMRDVGDYGLRGSIALGETATKDSVGALEALGAKVIEQKAKDAATQMAVFIEGHPKMTVADLQADPGFWKLAVQPVGETGYTVVLDIQSGIYYFHSRADLMGTDSHAFQKTLPSVWAIQERMLARGEDSAGYFDWPEADGSIRQKYMAMTAVGATTGDGRRMFVAATTYIDEFSRPAREMRDRLTAATQESGRHINGQLDDTLRTFILALAGLVAAVVAVSIVLSRMITNPILALSRSAQGIQRGERFEPSALAGLNRSRDELADLAQVFTRMAVEVQAREAKLKEEVQELRIEIDHAKKAKQVAEITATDYFQNLREKAQRLRAVEPSKES